MNTQDNKNKPMPKLGAVQDAFLCEVQGVPNLEQAEFIARQFVEDGYTDIIISHGPPFEVTAKCRPAST